MILIRSKNICQHTFLFALMLASLFTAGCKNSKSGRNSLVSSLQAPESSNTLQEVKESNFYIDHDTIHVLGVVSNKDVKACRQLIAIEFFDANNQMLDVKGAPFQKADTVHTINPTVLGMGWSGFSYTIPKNAVVGTVQSVKVRPIGATFMESKRPILFESQGFFKALKSDTDIATGEVKQEPIEVSWNGNGQIINPFDVSSFPPHLELWVFGTDNKLYVVEHLDPSYEKARLNIGSASSLAPMEKRPVTIKVDVETLPQVLKDLKIGRIEVQAFN
jgi:hypothetical protein